MHGGGTVQTARARLQTPCPAVRTWREEEGGVLIEVMGLGVKRGSHPLSPCHRDAFVAVALDLAGRMTEGPLWPSLAVPSAWGQWGPGDVPAQTQAPLSLTMSPEIPMQVSANLPRRACENLFAKATLPTPPGCIMLLVHTHPLLSPQGAAGDVEEV